MSDFDRLMGDSLKAVRDDHLRQIEPNVPAARGQIENRLRGRRFRFVIGGVAVAAAALAAILFVTQTIPGLERSAPIRPSGEPVVLTRIDVPGVGAMEPGFDRLWVAHEKGLVAIDPDSSAIESDWPVRNVDAMAMNSEAMYTIDSDGLEINRLGLGTNESAFAMSLEATPTAVVASDQTVWVAAAAGPEGHSQILAYTPHLEMPGDSAVVIEERVVAGMTHAENALWMTLSTPAGGFEVRRYSDDGGQKTWELSVSEGDVADIVVGEGAAWVLRHQSETGGHAITRIDLETNEVVERAMTFGGFIESLAVGEGYLWVTTVPAETHLPYDLAAASLHRIDPETLEPVGDPLEVSGSGSKLAVGYGYVWVGDPNNKQIVQIDPSGERTPEPEPSTPEPEQTSPREEASRCRTFLPFTTSDGSYSLGLGSGGQRDMPLREQSPPALVHYAGREGRHISVVPGDPIWPPFDEEPIQVLGTDGTFHRIEDGYAVTFSIQGCDFQLIAYTGEDEVRSFVESLVLRDDPGSTYDAFAMWPETTPEEAYTGCLRSTDSYWALRQDPETTALEFARDRLRWADAEVDPSLVFNLKEGHKGYKVARDGAEGSPSVVVMLREVAASCWSVTSLRTWNDDVPEDAPTGLSVSSADGKTSVGFDLDREAAGHPVDSVRLIVGPGQVLLSAEEFERKEGFIELTDAPVAAPTSFLVLLFDEERNVVGAIGQALPSGDFVAG